MLDFNDIPSPYFTMADMAFHTKPTVCGLDYMGSDLSIVNAAKVSFSAKSTLEEDGSLRQKDIQLLQYLARGMPRSDYDDMIQFAVHGDEDDIRECLESWRGTPIHKSPYNHVFASFRVKASIAVARQLVKHEYLPWNEVSGRYVEFKPEFMLPEEFRAHSADVKQGSAGIVADTGVPESIYKQSCLDAYRSYHALLQGGVCREQARLVLPLSTMTEWVWSGSLFAFQKMCAARTRDDTQPETQDVAYEIQSKLYGAFPEAMYALDTYGAS